MGFSFSNFLKSKKEPISNQPIQKINFEGGTKYAENETSDVYLDFEELGGFPFIKTILIGDFPIKVKRNGCTLTFLFENETLTIHSDNTNIESNSIKNSPFYISEIDFEIDENQATKIKNNPVLRIEYAIKNETYSFKTV